MKATVIAIAIDIAIATDIEGKAHKYYKFSVVEPLGASTTYVPFHVGQIYTANTHTCTWAQMPN